jgi:hypothetical protein
LTEVEHRIVHPGANVRQRQQRLRTWQVASAHGVGERLHVALLQRGDEPRPGFEAALTRDGQLRVGELQRPAGRAGVAPRGADARERAGVAVARGAQQILGELVLLFEIRGRPPS